MQNYHEMITKAQLNQQKRLKTAEAWRLAQEAERSVPQVKSVYGPMLAKAGKTLAQIGHELQLRYGEEETPSLPAQVGVYLRSD